MFDSSGLFVSFSPILSLIACYVRIYTARIVVVKISGPPILCKTDEIGEICVQSMSAGSAYWGLQGKSTHTFKVRTLGIKQLY